MSTTVTKVGNTVKSTWSAYMKLVIDTGYSATKVKITATIGLYYNKKHTHNTYYDSPIGFEGSIDKYWYTSKSGNYTKTAGTYLAYSTTTLYVTKKKTSFTATVSGFISHMWNAVDTTDISGVSTANYSFTVPAITNYAVTYNGNKPSAALGTVSNVPAKQTKYYGTNLALSSTKPTLADYTFTGWNTKADGTGTSYSPGSTYSGNAALTLYAKWSSNNPPTIDRFDEPEIGGFISSRGNPIRDFSTVNIGFSGASWYSSRTLSSIVMTCGADTVTLTSSDLTDGAGVFSFTPSASGTYPITVTIKDSANISVQYALGNITIEKPTWTKDCTFTTDAPAKASNGTPMLISAQVYNYTTSSWDTVTVTTELSVDEDSWSFPYTFDEDHVSDPTDDNPTTQIRVSYTHYVEVGSNDTTVQGLTKVGDYLGVIKQSKTTDTAIYLLYPTSFDEDTTYAVKQGVQGVGALSKYAFNILGDETLFLSPNGVMAITPGEDSDHRVQNRSYYVDGRLLQEDGLQEAYSFVYDGKYWLAVGGRCYVLDGNQRNSWGNDRTNLVYECYFLENVPALCFAKYNDRLIFSTSEEVCRFKAGSYDDVYLDDFMADSPIIEVYTPEDVDQATFEASPTDYFYIGSDGEYTRCTALSVYDPTEQYFTRSSQHETVNVPVRAEWSTILDDDGYLNFYKNLQKKGSVVSILPTGYKYVVSVIDEAAFLKNPEAYYTYDGAEYKHCSASDSFDVNETYYVKGASSTKVFVKKDGDDPVEIERSFNEASDIPSEMFIRKKIKKYKRLQFIVRNDDPENFGIDSIIKNYSIGNYAKK